MDNVVNDKTPSKLTSKLDFFLKIKNTNKILVTHDKYETRVNDNYIP